MFWIWVTNEAMTSLKLKPNISQTGLKLSLKVGCQGTMMILSTDAMKLISTVLTTSAQ